MGAGLSLPAGLWKFVCAWSWNRGRQGRCWIHTGMLSCFNPWNLARRIRKQLSLIQSSMKILVQLWVGLRTPHRVVAWDFRTIGLHVWKWFWNQFCPVQCVLFLQVFWSKMMYQSIVEDLCDMRPCKKMKPMPPSDMPPYHVLLDYPKCRHPLARIFESVFLCRMGWVGTAGKWWWARAGSG